MSSVSALARGQKTAVGDRLAWALGRPRTGFHPPREKASVRARRQDRRAAKFQLRAGLKPITPNPTFRRCGTTPCSASGVGVRVTETSPGHRRAGFSGLATCGSVWLCPVCAAKIAAGRADELSTVLGNAKKLGYQVAMVTLTVRHKATDPLEDVWGAVSRGWNRVTSGKGLAERPTPLQHRWMGACGRGHPRG